MRGRTTKSMVPAAPPLIQGDLGSLGHPKARSFTSQPLASTGSSHWNATWTKRWDQEAEELTLGCVLAARAALQPWGSLHTHPKQHQLWAAITIPCGYQAPALWCCISHLFWQSVNFLPSPNCAESVKADVYFDGFFFLKAAKPDYPRPSQGNQTMLSALLTPAKGSNELSGCPLSPWPPCPDNSGLFFFFLSQVCVSQCFCFYLQKKVLKYVFKNLNSADGAEGLEGFTSTCPPLLTAVAAVTRSASTPFSTVQSPT